MWKQESHTLNRELSRGTNENAYYFIVGLPRSGSTLLAYILNAHPNVKVMHEDNAEPFNDISDRDTYNLRWKIKRGFIFYLKNCKETQMCW